MTDYWINSISQSISGIRDKSAVFKSRLSSVKEKVIGSIDLSKKTRLLMMSENFQSFVGTIAVGIEKINMDLDSEIVTFEEIKQAYDYLQSNNIIVKTPTLRHVQSLFKDRDDIPRQNDEPEMAAFPESVDLYLKLENMQKAGSFKIRGCANQMRNVKKQNSDKTKLVTFSAGNYGKAFAYCVGGMGVSATCIMPETVPSNRVSVIKGLGVDVKLVPTASLKSEVDSFVADGYRLCQSFDDVDLIAGHASAGMELLEDVPDPDIVLVCCGGGGLVSGISAAISYSGLKDCRVYAVEPEGAPCMYESFKSRRPVTLPHVKSVATGLSPPYAGSICYKHCRWFVEDVLLVTDEEILSAMRLLYHRGIKAEPSGCAAMAALLFNKVPDVAGKKVAVFITGGNVTSSELVTLIRDAGPS